MHSTGRTAHRESRVIALLFLDRGTKRGWGVSVTPRPLFTSVKDPVPTVQEAGWDPGPVWTGAENLVPTGNRSPDRPARSQSLYRLSYTDHVNSVKNECSLLGFFTVLQGPFVSIFRAGKWGNIRLVSPWRYRQTFSLKCCYPFTKKHDLIPE